jgi:hypothetical protein
MCATTSLNRLFFMDKNLKSIANQVFAILSIIKELLYASLANIKKPLLF